MGIHVAVEVAERSEAWRLPVFQKLRFEMGLFTAVTKGCSVGLKGNEGQLMQKGRIVTTHSRLADMLHKPCRCHAAYKHAKCEGQNATRSAGYTPEFARLVFEGFQREGGMSRIVDECTGQSQLPEGFGLGLMCACQGSECHCHMCVMSDNSEPGKEDLEAQAYYQSSPELEAQAKLKLLSPAQANLQDLKQLVMNHTPAQGEKSRRQPG